MAKQFKVNDIVLLIDDESPIQKRKRLGLPYKQSKDNRPRKMAYFDKVKNIANNKATTDKHNFLTQNLNTSSEDNANAQSRLARGEPIRKMYLALESWFPQTHIRGLNYDIESIELDEDFIKNVVIPYQE